MLGINSIRYTRTRDILFLASFCVYFFYCAIQTSFFSVYFNGENSFKIVAIVCILLLLAKELSSSIRNDTIVIIIIFLLFSAFVIKNGEGLGQKDLFFAIVYILSARNVSVRKILCASALICISILSLVIISSKLGLIHNFTDIRADGTVRNPLGFRWVLFAPTFYCELVAIVIYLYKNKLSIFALLALGGVGWWLYLETDARLCFMLTEALVIFVIIDKARVRINIKQNRIAKIATCVLTLSFIIAALLSVILTIIYDPENTVFANINSALSGRLYYGQNSLNEYGVSLFGIRGIDWIGHGRDPFGNVQLLEYNYVDCGYIVLLQRYGILFTAFWLICNTITLNIAYKNEDYYLIVIMSAIAVHCMIDDLQLALHYNIFWIFNTVILTNRVNCMRKEIVAYEE